MAAVPSQQEAEIRQHIESLAQALRAKDVEKLMRHYGRQVVVFDLRPPLKVDSADAYRRNFEAWFGSMQWPIDFQIYDLGITASNDVGFCRYLAHVRGKKTSGDATDYWVRVTAGCTKVGGRWLLTHEHISMPIDLETGQAVPDGERQVAGATESQS